MPPAPKLSDNGINTSALSEHPREREPMKGLCFIDFVQSRLAGLDERLFCDVESRELNVAVGVNRRGSRSQRVISRKRGAHS